MDYILSIDQGTSSSRAILFDEKARRVALHQLEFPQSFPKPGWVEHNPEDIWQTTIDCCREVLKQAGMPASDVRAIGISNQRETTVIWDRTTGEPIYPAIVWQDRRTADYCKTLQRDKAAVQLVTESTGLLLDPYFSASKIAWLLDEIPEVRRRAEAGGLAFGTIDCYLIWRLSNGRRHVTDVTNASRTLLFNIHTLQWDEALLRLFNIPSALLPDVLDNCGDFAECDAEHLGHAIPITGVAGDQQAAAFGQACFEPGMVKSTYGTGCFMLLNTGEQASVSQKRLLTTIGYRVNESISYALEGSIFNAGTAIKWLRDQLHFFKQASETESMVQTVEDNGGVFFVPAFTGLGAPYWNPDARGMIMGLTRDTQPAHIVRAALEAICFQTRDLLSAMMTDTRQSITVLRVDGGMVSNEWLLQTMSDLLQLQIQRPQTVETSALGAAYLAGLGAGIYTSLAEIAELWELQQQFYPQVNVEQSEDSYRSWQQAISAVLTFV